MPTPEMSDTTEALAARANVVSSRLASAIGALERRGRRALEVRKRLLCQTRVVRVLGVALVAGIAALALAQAITSEQRRRHQRWLMLRRAWTHPERVAIRKRSVLRRAAGALLVAGGEFLAMRALALLMRREEREARPTGRPLLVR